MADTAIEWTRNPDGSRGRVWNPTTGCDRASGPGCDHCYALTMANRLKGMGNPKYQRDGDPRTSGPGFALTVHPAAVNLPLRWRKPTRVFVNSMSDLYHPKVPDGWLADIFAVMAAAERHTFQVLTKRSPRARSLMADPAFVEQVFDRATGVGPNAGKGLPAARWTWPLPNVWMGVSVENSDWLCRADDLRATPAAVRFLSAEPLLGPLDGLDLTDIHWTITGGESGPGARRADPDWFRAIRDQCAEAGAAFFHKQMGSVWATAHNAARQTPRSDAAGRNQEAWPADLRVRQYPDAASA